MRGSTPPWRLGGNRKTWPPPTLAVDISSRCGGGGGGEGGVRAGRGELSWASLPVRLMLEGGQNCRPRAGGGRRAGRGVGGPQLGKNRR